MAGRRCSYDLARCPYLVMAGLVPAIHTAAHAATDVTEMDARNMSGHDGRGSGRVAVGTANGE